MSADDRYALVDIDVPLPEIWTFSTLSADERSDAEAELALLLADKVEDPAAVAEASVIEFFERIGGGGAPLMLASFREVLDDDSVLTASLMVTKNELGGSLEPWRDAYPDAAEMTVDGETALRTFEQSTVAVSGLFDQPLTVSTWRYLVPFDPRSILMFTFSSPNAELGDELSEYFDEIMDDVHVVSGPA